MTPMCTVNRQGNLPTKKNPVRVTHFLCKVHCGDSRNLKSVINSKKVTRAECSVLPHVLFYKHLPAVIEHLPPLKLPLLSWIQTHSGSERPEESNNKDLWYCVMRHFGCVSCPWMSLFLIQVWCLHKMFSRLRYRAVVRNLDNWPAVIYILYA